MAYTVTIVAAGEDWADNLFTTKGVVNSIEEATAFAKQAGYEVWEDYPPEIQDDGSDFHPTIAVFIIRGANAPHNPSSQEREDETDRQRYGRPEFLGHAYESR